MHQAVHSTPFRSLPENLSPASGFTWERVAWNLLLSRALDRFEEQDLFRKKIIPMQFSATGHELSQTILGMHLSHGWDGVTLYYRCRPLVLALGLSLTQIVAGPLGHPHSMSKGRDGGMVFHRPGGGQYPSVLPMCGDVGAQFTQAVGWAQAIRYRQDQLGDSGASGAIAVAVGGDGSVATGGFWSALTIATTLDLPMLFFIEDNGLAISVPSILQTPRGDIAANLASFSNLTIYSGDGTDPIWLREQISLAVSSIRAGHGPVLIRVQVPRLTGHSVQDTQAYRSSESLSELKDPLLRLRRFIESGKFAPDLWNALEQHADELVHRTYAELQQSASADRVPPTRHVFFSDAEGAQVQGGTLPELGPIRRIMSTVGVDPIRINLAAAIRRTLESELHSNKRLVVFGQDVGPKGGVHGVSAGLQQSFGSDRVFDTSLSEEGIMGRAVGFALCGLVPCPEIQFRKYADAAMEQIRNIGTMRWRTANNFAAPMVLRMTVGSAGREDHWHNLSDESIWAHLVGWKIVFPSNAQDAVGLLRTALRGNDPVMFLEHRALLDNSSARSSYPGDHFVLPFGKANVVRVGEELTLVTWGQMVHRSMQAIEASGRSVELLDLRTIIPWDVESVRRSVQKTGRLLIVHEDCITCGFGAEISAVVGEQELLSLEAPITRLAVPDLPIPYRGSEDEEVIPSTRSIAKSIVDLVCF